jgi:DNA-directed RNA polymerase specialized sigma subunit
MVNNETVEAALWKAYHLERTIENRNRLVEHYLPLAQRYGNIFRSRSRV